MVRHFPRGGGTALTHVRRLGGSRPSFTIHDREDLGDLINLVRHEQGFSEKSKRFPLKATCLAIYSRAVNATDPLDVVLRKQFPWCTQWEEDLRILFDAYVAVKQKQHVLDYDDCCSIGPS